MIRRKKIMPKGTVLIAGGAGFIGSHLCDRMIVEGYDVIAVDNEITGRADNVKHLGEHKNFTYYKIAVENINNGGFYENSSRKKIDFIFHFASIASPVGYKKFPIETMLANSIGTLKLLELALTENCGFMYASTSEVYGDPLEHPQTEGYYGNVNPVGSRSMYDEAKRFGEALVVHFCTKHFIPAKIIRIFNTYGQRMSPNDGRVIPTFIEQARLGMPYTISGDGQQTRSFCYIQDLIDGIFLFFKSEYCGVINLGNPEEYTIRAIAKKIHDAYNPIRLFSVIQDNHGIDPDDPKQRRPDITKAQQILGWNPKVSIDQGLERTVKHARC